MNVFQPGVDNYVMEEDEALFIVHCWCSEVSPLY